MSEIFAQGDLLIERVRDVPVSGTVIAPAADGAFVLAEGETSGHRHHTYDNVTFFRDDGLARDIPGGLYVGHVRVTDSPAKISHDEHSAITLPPGTWRVRRQRELEPRDVNVVRD